MRFRREVIVVSGVVLMVLYGSGSGGGDGSALIGPMGCEAAQTTAQPSPKHKRSFTDNLHSGIKLASSIFGLDATTSEVANLVAKAFAKPANQRADGDTGRQSSPDAGATPFGSMAPPGMIITNLLRMFGLDGSKIGAMAVNGIILIAQMIGKTLSDSDTSSSADTNHSESGRSTQRAEAPPINGNGSANDRKPEDTDADADADADDDDDDDITTGSPFDWIIDSKSPVLQTALLAVRDRQLPLRIADAIGALEQRPGEAGCIQLLLCKCAPFVWGMQRSLAERIDGPDGGDAPDAAPAQSKEQQQQQPAEEPSRLDGFFRHLPAMREFRENGAECERRHASCFAKKSR